MKNHISRPRRAYDKGMKNMADPGFSGRWDTEVGDTDSEYVMEQGNIWEKPHGAGGAVAVTSKLHLCTIDCISVR